MELIKINTSKGGKKVVDARELWNFLCIETQFSIWIQRMIEYGFKEGIDYSKMIAENERVNFYYALTIDAAKHIAMIQRNEKGMEARNYFIECEKIAYQPIKFLPKTRLELARENVLLIEEIELKDALLLEAKPKTDFFDAVTQGKAEISIGEAAKVLSLPYGSITLFKKLRWLGVLMHDNIPYQSHISNGWFRVVENRYVKRDGTWGISLKTVVYQKGLDGIRKLLSK